MESKIEIIPMAEQDWERLRDLRLEMLADTPTAYLEPLATARSLVRRHHERVHRRRHDLAGRRLPRAALPGQRGGRPLEREMVRVLL